LFEVLKRRCPEDLQKLVPISGDCMELGLGLSPTDSQMLEQKVSIVFHAAASVSFDDTLKYATITNTRATQEVMLLARNMKNLKVGMFISKKTQRLVLSYHSISLYPNLQDKLTYYSLIRGLITRPQSTSSQL
jgi:thioester reductase-like protein